MDDKYPSFIDKNLYLFLWKCEKIQVNKEIKHLFTQALALMTYQRSNLSKSSLANHWVYQGCRSMDAGSFTVLWTHEQPHCWKAHTSRGDDLGKLHTWSFLHDLHPSQRTLCPCLCLSPSLFPPSLLHPHSLSLINNWYNLYNPWWGRGSISLIHYRNFQRLGRLSLVPESYGSLSKKNCVNAERSYRTTSTGQQTCKPAVTTKSQTSWFSHQDIDTYCHIIRNIKNRYRITLFFMWKWLMT